MEHWRESFIEVVIATAPITVLIILFKLIILGGSFASFIQVLVGSLMAVAGLAIFLTGARAGILAFGERLGNTLPQYGSLSLLIVFAVVLGFVVTVAEPNVRVLTSQLELASPGFLSPTVLVVSVALGLAIFVGLGILRTVLQIRVVYFLVPSYLLLFILIAFVSPEYVALGFDSGGAATGPLTVPFLLAFNVGIAGVLARHSGVGASFGTLALAAIGPVLALLLLGLLPRGGA